MDDPRGNHSSIVKFQFASNFEFENCNSNFFLCTRDINVFFGNITSLESKVVFATILKSFSKQNRSLDLFDQTSFFSILLPKFSTNFIQYHQNRLAQTIKLKWLFFQQI